MFSADLAVELGGKETYRADILSEFSSPPEVRLLPSGGLERNVSLRKASLLPS